MSLSIETRDVVCGDGRTLRIGLLFGPDGSVHELVLAAGSGSGADWREDPAEGLTLPARTLYGLLSALAALIAARDHHDRVRALEASHV